MTASSLTILTIALVLFIAAGFGAIRVRKVAKEADRKSAAREAAFLAEIDTLRGTLTAKQTNDADICTIEDGDEASTQGSLGGVPILKAGFPDWLTDEMRDMGTESAEAEDPDVDTEDKPRATHPGTVEDDLRAFFGGHSPTVPTLANPIATEAVHTASVVEPYASDTPDNSADQTVDASRIDSAVASLVRALRSAADQIEQDVQAGASARSSAARAVGEVAKAIEALPGESEDQPAPPA